MAQQVDAAAAGERKVNRKARVGTVVSDHGDQTIVVTIERAARHRLYHKVIRRTKRYHVHDPENQATTGDLVRIEECRPISKTKRWRLVEVLTERQVAEVRPEAIDEELVAEVQRSAAHAAEGAHVAGAGSVAAAAAGVQAAVAEAPEPSPPAPDADIEVGAEAAEASVERTGDEDDKGDGAEASEAAERTE